MSTTGASLVQVSLAPIRRARGREGEDLIKNLAFVVLKASQ
jgi:hypothetical protein